jgi:ankyrin repeat protein
MNEAMLQMVQGVERLYPQKLEEQFPRVFGKVIELWDTPQLDDYFKELMMNDRPGRQGFPTEIAAEIFRLSQVRERTLNKPKSAFVDVWGEVELEELKIIESSGFERTSAGFLKSSESGNLKVVTAFVKNGADLNTRDERGWTPLMISAFNGNQEIARLLLEHGADIHVADASGYNPIHWAAFNGFTDVVKMLIDKNANIDAKSKHGWTPLLQAATRGHLSTCEALISSGADVNLSSNDGWSPLHKACANGHIEIVKLLLKSGANKNATYQDATTPIMLAQRAKKDAIVALLKD